MDDGHGPFIKNSDQRDADCAPRCEPFEFRAGTWKELFKLRAGTFSSSFARRRSVAMPVSSPDPGDLAPGRPPFLASLPKRGRGGARGYIRCIFWFVCETHKQ